MTHSPNQFSTPRAPRVKLAGSVLVLVQLEDSHQVRARLHQLSVNGGLLHLPEPLQEESPVQLMFHIGSTTVRARAETISPMWATQGCLQPFRFIELPDHDRARLDADLQAMLGRDALPQIIPGRAQLAEDEPADNLEGEASPEIPGPVNTSLFVPSGPAEKPIEANPEDIPEGVSEVRVYFECPEDAIRFTVALSSVIFSEQGTRTRDDVARLAREFGKISRVTTKGRLLHGGVSAQMMPSHIV
jgi:hypothetical protein